MEGELKINIQWLPGAIIPVLIHKSCTAERLSDLLQFSCFENEKVYLFFNGIVLNPDETLIKQGIKNGDIIECKIVSKIQNIEDLFKKEDQTISREIARVLDMQTDKLRPRNEIKKLDTNSSYSDSDSDSYQFLFLQSNDLTPSNNISTEPLPILWQNEDYGDAIYKYGTNVESHQNEDNSDSFDEMKKALPEE
ncbi:uncharacterized protein GO595_001387 [Histomonas meleagridis]|uniref:uncharacterized protein n=1 Tax=Histomonas meleagridis TaxID=135588 RepID=UPI00355A9765|nr:hypothetical protein GO595_001387 [Histomonas meleagridis]